jgi:hypothetical protein
VVQLQAEIVRLNKRIEELEKKNWKRRTGKEESDATAGQIVFFDS